MVINSYQITKVAQNGESSYIMTWTKGYANYTEEEMKRLLKSAKVQKPEELVGCQVIVKIENDTRTYAVIPNGAKFEVRVFGEANVRMRKLKFF